MTGNLTNLISSLGSDAILIRFDSCIFALCSGMYLNAKTIKQTQTQPPIQATTDQVPSLKSQNPAPLKEYIKLAIKQTRNGHEMKSLFLSYCYQYQ